MVWTFLFQTQLGILVVLAMTAMYFLRERPVWRDIVVAVLGLATIPPPLSVLLIHFHKPGPSMFPKWVYYGSYPSSCSSLVWPAISCCNVCETRRWA